MLLKTIINVTSSVHFANFYVNEIMAYFMPSSHKLKTGEPSKLLVDPEGNVYRLKRPNKTTKVWNCSMKEERNCKAEVKTNLEVS